MSRAVILVVFLVFGLSLSGAVSANPLTFYTNEAAWQAAVSGHNVGTYTSDVRQTDVQTSIGTDGSELYNAGTSHAVSQVGFTNFSTSLSDAGINFDEDCFTLYPPCVAQAGTTEVKITFHHPIFGFSANSEFISEGVPLLLNGEVLPDFSDFAGFFGVVGQISRLDFQTNNPFTDDFTDISLQNIVVAAIPEPYSATSFGTGLLFFVLVAFASRKRDASGS